MTSDEHNAENYQDREEPTVDTPQEFAKWLKQKENEARGTYKSGPRSENPRRSDVALGSLRAYRDAYRTFLEASEKDVSDLVG